MVPYSRTGSAVSKRVFNTSVSVLDKAQKNLGDSTHNIGKTRSMQMMAPSLSGADGTKYAKAPT